MGLSAYAVLGEKMIRRPVLTKSDMYKRWLRNEFGNRLRMWTTRQEWLDSGFKGRMGLRYNIPGSRFCKYNLEHEEVDAAVEQFVFDGADRNLILYCEAAPDMHITMQGEVIQSPNSYELLYSTVKAQMRTALSERPQWARGLDALNIIKQHMNNVSHEDFQELMTAYPEHAIEFSCYDINVGNAPHRNTLIWEVRKY